MHETMVKGENEKGCVVYLMKYLCVSISFRVVSQAMGQSYDCPSGCEITLMDMEKNSVALLTLGQPYDCPSGGEVTLKDMGGINLQQQTSMYEQYA